MDYKCYIIFNDNYSYVGITNNLTKRLRQHNKEIKGGAKYTSMIKDKIKHSKWNYACYIEGFKNKNDALKFEWALKHVKPKYKSGIINRINKLIILLNKPKWTKKSPLSINYKLNIVWFEIFLIPEIINLPNYISYDFINS